jgi:activator of 2-hydroxyglutaryl-CoA dehydratase
MNTAAHRRHGRFLEVVSQRLEVRGTARFIPRRSENPAHISSICVVFAETENVGLLACGSLAKI